MTEAEELWRSTLPIWGVLALVVLLVIGFGLRTEWRSYAKRGLAGPWLYLRLATIPIALVTAAAVWFPSSAVGGPEALAVFYGLLLLGAPVLYFGLHWLVGKMVLLSSSDAIAVGATGLAILIGPALAAQLAQPWVFEFARGVKEARRALAPEKPAPFRIAGQQRFTLPEVGEVWAEHWQVSPGVTIERVEFEFKGDYVRADGGGSTLCRSGADAHVLWQAAYAPPRWRVEWKAADGALARSSHLSVPPAAPAIAFEVKWLADGFVLPARIARQVASLGRTFSDGRESFDSLDTLQPGETFFENCLPLEYRRVNAAKEQPLTAVSFRFWRWDTQQQLRATFRRPAAEPVAPAVPAQEPPKT